MQVLIRGSVILTLVLLGAAFGWVFRTSWRLQEASMLPRISEAVVRWLISRDVNGTLRRAREKAPNRAFSSLKAPTTFTKFEHSKNM